MRVRRACVSRLPRCFALRHSLRTVLEAHEDAFLSMHLRSILRRHGPLPLPRLTPLLSEEAVEVLPRVAGGLRRYMHDRPAWFRVEALSTGVCVALLAAEVDRAGAGADVVAIALAHVAASPQAHASTAAVFAALPALQRRRCGGPAALEAFLQRYPQLVSARNGVVRAAGPPLARRAPVVVGADGPSAAPPTETAADDPMARKLLALLQSAVPCEHYVPLRLLLRHPRRAMCVPPDASVAETLSALRRLPASTLDCRVLGPSEDAVFLRMMDAERRLVLADDPQTAAPFEVLPLAEPMLDAFRAFAARGEDALRRLRGGLAVTELPDALPPPLLRQLEQHFGPAQPSGASILVFDRLRHVFDVHLAAYRVRPWAVLAAHEQPSSLTWQTTPTPVLLQQTLFALHERPLTPSQLLSALTTRARRQLDVAYKEVDRFVELHSLYLVVREGMVCTPRQAALAQGARVPLSCKGGQRGDAGTWGRCSEAQKAEMLAALMPLAHPVDWHRFRVSPAVRNLPFEAMGLRQDFFERNRNYFRVYEVFGASSLVVGRRDGTMPPAHLLHPPCNSLSDLIRLMALFSVGGASETTIMNNLSKEARAMMRRYGTLEGIAQQLPMWFEVRNERREQGAAFISYIGAERDGKRNGDTTR